MPEVVVPQRFRRQPHERRRLQPRRVRYPHDHDHGPPDHADDHHTRRIRRRRRRWRWDWRRHHDCRAANRAADDRSADDRDSHDRCPGHDGHHATSGTAAGGVTPVRAGHLLTLHL
jgi:hypothetical protein